jgi:hypothetical protein
MQYEITQPSRLLDKNGELIQKGYATSPMLKYRRAPVKDRRLRLKEWDYYLIYNDNYGVALVVGDSPLAGLISASIIDFSNPSESAKTAVTVFPLKKLHMPESSVKGDIFYKDLSVTVSFRKEKTRRKLYMEFKNLYGDSDFKASLVLFDEPTDSMVIATPFKEDPKAFYYNRKIIGMRASGTVNFKGKVYNFSPDASFGLLDWGRGVWPYRTTWYWSAAQGMINDNLFGFNLGYGFGDTSAATENMLFYNGIAQKLEDVSFIIPKKPNNQFDYMKPWTFTSSDRRIEMNFIPIFDRTVSLSAVVLSTDQHQVFGRFTGKAVLDDGMVVEIKDFMGFAERVENRW